mmetsp:Transcript_38680/g.81060  ORF Transcript_38680/g.81060 Transcript_38680/m.81060 type:complete len:87 (+) Transcript_38680:1378-1638(+)
MALNGERVVNNSNRKEVNTMTDWAPKVIAVKAATQKGNKIHFQEMMGWARADQECGTQTANISQCVRLSDEDVNSNQRRRKPGYCG